MGQRLALPGKVTQLELEEDQSMNAEAVEGKDVEEAPGRITIGLYNIGLSCCLNSLLQMFFMNTDFTAILRRIQVPEGATERRESVPYQMLLLLEQMQHSRRRAVHPLGLARCLSKHNVQFFVLYDAAQLFQILWNLIKTQITIEDLAKRLIGLYTIRVQEYLVCQKCLLETKRDSNMISLPLPMFNYSSCAIRTLEDSLRCFFEPEQLTESNTCHCEECGRKTRSLKVIKYLPQILTLHLKRFCCKKSSRTQKISHFLSFPQSLDFNQILTPEHCSLDAEEKADWLYELFAVIAHSGSASFGHYCAYIWRRTEPRWYCFNDSSVCQVSWDDVKWISLFLSYPAAGLEVGK
uniref:Ubiquitin specific peptidase 18 n=1 Tax=Sphenodon punctatus TaxID=8508 RepID=A0A8D0GWA5_SPHPU